MPRSKDAIARALANYDGKRTRSKVRLTPRVSDLLDEICEKTDEARAAAAARLIEKEHARLFSKR